MSASMPQDLLKVKGKPVIMGHSLNLTEVVRVPEISLLTNSKSPIRISQNLSSENHPIRLSNSDKLDWVGNRMRDRQSRNASYVLLDRGTYYECVSITDAYEFVPATEDRVGEEEVDAITKRQKILRAKEAAAAQRVSSNILSGEADEEAEPAAAPSKKRRRDSDELLTGMPLNDLKVRTQLLRSKKARDLDGRAQAQSSTALGEIRKAEVDWDYEEGVASDDEEGAALSSEEIEDKQEEDVEDSENEDKVLTNYGESLSKMLQNQKRAEADQELQGYSEEEDEEGAPSSITVSKPQRPAQPHPSSQVPVTSQVQTEERVREDLLNLLRSRENVTIKMILVELGISARNQKFQLIKNLITELCDIVTTTVNGEQVRYIKIKS